MWKFRLPDITWRELFTLDLKRVDWRRTILLIALILATAAALWQWFCPPVRIITQNQFHPVPVIKAVEKVKTVRVACPERGLVVLDKQTVADKLDIPWLQGGDIASAKVSEEVTSPSAEGASPVPGNPRDLQITATAQLPESKSGYQVVAVVDTATGVTTQVVKEEPAPWFQLRNDAAMGVRYGICSGDSLYCGTTYGRWDFLRVKDVYLSANGDLSTDGAARLQFGAEYRW